MNSDEFVSLCERLRALGATEVAAGEMRAAFGPVISRRPSAKPDASYPESFASPEEAERWRARARQGR